MAPKISEYTYPIKNSIAPALKPVHQELHAFLKSNTKEEFEQPVPGEIANRCSFSKCRLLHNIPAKILPNLNAKQSGSTESTVYIFVIYFNTNLNTFSTTTVSVKVPQQLFKQKTQIITLFFYDQDHKDLDGSVSSYSLHKMPCESSSAPYVRYCDCVVTSLMIEEILAGSLLCMVALYCLFDIFFKFQCKRYIVNNSKESLTSTSIASLPAEHSQQGSNLLWRHDLYNHCT